MKRQKGLEIYFEGRATGLADRLNRVRQNEEPRMTSRFGATGYTLLLFTEKGNNKVWQSKVPTGSSTLDMLCIRMEMSVKEADISV